MFALVMIAALSWLTPRVGATPMSFFGAPTEDVHQENHLPTEGTWTEEGAQAHIPDAGAGEEEGCDDPERLEDATGEPGEEGGGQAEPITLAAMPEDILAAGVGRQLGRATPIWWLMCTCTALHDSLDLEHTMLDVGISRLTQRQQ